MCCVVLCDFADMISTFAATGMLLPVCCYRYATTGMLGKGLEPIHKAVAEHVIASQISEDQLTHVRSSIGSILVPFSSSGDETDLNELLKLSRTANNFW